MTAILHLVGVGPGDPELLTLKAVRILGSAAVVAYPSTGDKSALALEIAGTHLNPAAEHLVIPLPMQVDRTPAVAAYDQAAERILAQLRAQKSVAYLCEGDPLFYGSAMYLLARIAPHATVSIVPGVTSLTASAAAIQRPLCARNEILKVLPAPLPNEVLRAELASAPAVAIIKVGRHFDRICALLVETGHAPGAIVVEHATTAAQRIGRLADFGPGARPYFSTILCYSGTESWNAEESWNSEAPWTGAEARE